MKPMLRRLGAVVLAAEASSSAAFDLLRPVQRAAASRGPDQAQGP